MKNKNEIEALKEAISELKSKQAQELALLKMQFKLTYESLKPQNLLKIALHEASVSPQNLLLNNAVGLAAGYVSKKIFMGKSHNPIRNILGTLLQLTVANVVAKHSGTVIQYLKEKYYQLTEKGVREEEEEQKYISVEST